MNIAFFDHADDEVSLSRALKLIQILQWGTSHGARQHASQGVLRCAIFQGVRPGHVAQRTVVVGPEMDGGLCKGSAMGGEMVRFAEQMRHCEADVEGGVAEMNYFVIEQDEVSVAHEDVLGAV